MKLQLVYLFVLAAPLLVQLLSRETVKGEAATAATEPAPIVQESEPQTAEKPASSPARKPVKKSPSATKRPIPAPQAYTFM